MSAAAPVPVKLVSEAVRERETFKYEPNLLSDFRFVENGQLPASLELATSKDSILTALAQLGCYQTETDRAFISLFDSSHQYIIAEATASVPLTPGLSSRHCPTSLSLCGTAIPRAHGTCEPVLYHVAGTGHQQYQEITELPIHLVRDLTADSRFSSTQHRQIGEPDQFYAAVPIRTRRGINIGAYCVVSRTKMQSWTKENEHRLREISYAIMDHLEANRAKQAYRRSERMNRGLGSFIEGKSTVSGWQSGPNIAAFMNDVRLEGALDSTQQHLVSRSQEQKNESENHTTSSKASDEAIHRLVKRPNGPYIAGFCSPYMRQFQNRGNTNSVTEPGNRPFTKQPKLSNNGTNVIFSRAANIIRESFEVAGCHFYDVSIGSYRVPAVRIPNEGRDSDGAASQFSSTSSSDEHSVTSPVELPDALCDLLGFSTSNASSINATDLDHGEGVLPKRFLAKLLRRYPDGKIFNFDSVGELQSSDSSGDDNELSCQTEELSSIRTHNSDDGSLSTAAKRMQASRRFSRIKEAALIQQAFPNARSVAFVPVWDSKRERWSAGGFVYTLTPSRVFTLEGELSFFKAFTKLVATEVHNVETLQANKAKSDALGALSHELRSPLHGVILGTELLNDTDLTVFQGNTMHTIETCCRTLLDTIDQLLDYSKINNLAAKSQRELDKTKFQAKTKATSNEFGKKMLLLHARLDRLVEEVIESMFAGFNFQRMSIRQLSKQQKPVNVDTKALNKLDSALAMEQLGTGSISHGGEEQNLYMGNVAVYMSVDSAFNWQFRLNAGAIRRIIMNLFGNSLKYTVKGAIHVSLTQEQSPNHPRVERLVKITVRDTGQGITEDYLRHELFKPFSQEDELASGTGLGLSLVKSLVSQLRGQILVESQVGVGTAITILLPLEQSPQIIDLPKDDEEFEEQVRDLSGLRVSLLGFDHEHNQDGVDGGRPLVERLLRQSLHLELIPKGKAKLVTPDLVIWSDDVLPIEIGNLTQFSSSPNVVVCQDAVQAYSRFAEYESAGHRGIFEFVSQPIGPRKLAKTIYLAYKRWMGLPKPLPVSRPNGLNRSRSSYAVPQSTGLKTIRQPNSSDPEINTIPEIQAAANEEASTLSANTALKTPRPQVKEKLAEPQEVTTEGKILLVDDNHINLKVLSAYMSKLGRSYEAVFNGKEAFDSYTQNPSNFAGILMDISMPVMDGLEATRLIRAHERKNQCNPVVILALTGLASDQIHQEALESGINVFLTKPVRLKTLCGVLESTNVLSSAGSDGNPR